MRLVINKKTDERKGMAKIGVITLSRIRMEKSSFYNFQDVGLAEALAKAGNMVSVYRFTMDEDKEEERGRLRFVYRRVKGIGQQSVTNFSFLEEETERLICFSDNQVSFPGLYRWCKRKQVLLQPYVGVLYSNSPHFWARRISNFLVSRNVRLYRQLRVYGKTPYIVKDLEQHGVTDTQVVPVCLDRRLLHMETVNAAQVKAVREGFGYQMSEKILLFIGRMEEEKEPLAMIEIFDRLYRKHPDYRLMMVGKGVLYREVEMRIRELGLMQEVQLVEQIANREIWKLYCFSSCFINLNRNEIYGMSILEAMFYRCPVAAMRAPGPEYLIEQERTGYLCDTQEELMQTIEEVVENETKLGDTRKYVESKFYWEQVIGRFWE